MNQYTYFLKDKYEIRDEKEQLIAAPAFISKSPKNHRYNHATSVLEKRCIECHNYFPIQKFDGSKFYGIHDEEIIHMYSIESGYEYRCNLCIEQRKEKTSFPNNLKTDEELSLSLTSDNLRYI